MLSLWGMLSPSLFGAVMLAFETNVVSVWVVYTGDEKGKK